jgi:hypothetical protein
MTACWKDGRFVPCGSGQGGSDCIAMRVIPDGTEDPMVEISQSEHPDRVISVKYHEVTQFRSAGRIPGPDGVLPQQ